MGPSNEIKKSNKRRLVRFFATIGILSFSGGISLLIIGGLRLLTTILGAVFVLIGIVSIVIAVVQWAKHL